MRNDHHQGKWDLKKCLSSQPSQAAKPPTRAGSQAPRANGPERGRKGQGETATTPPQKREEAQYESKESAHPLHHYRLTAASHETNVAQDSVSWPHGGQPYQGWGRPITPFRGILLFCSKKATDRNFDFGSKGRENKQNQVIGVVGKRRAKQNSYDHPRPHQLG